MKTLRTMILAGVLGAALGCAGNDAASVVRGFDAGASDEALPDAAASLVYLPGENPAGPDAGPPPFVGTWHSCSLRRTFSSDGTWESVSYPNNACRSTGTWRLHRDRVDVHTAASTCPSPPPDLPDALLALEGHQLVIVHPDVGSQGVWRGLDDTVPRQRWHFDGTRFDGSPGVTIVRVVGDPRQDGSGCYWSGDGACNGLFACAGVVYQWEHGNAMLGGGLSCAGCTCGASLVGAITTDRITAHFYAQNCERVWQGDVVGVAEADPRP